jgi:hypothetical protein
MGPASFRLAADISFASDWVCGIHSNLWHGEKKQIPFGFAQGRLFDCATCGRFAQDDTVYK